LTVIEASLLSLLSADRWRNRLYFLGSTKAAVNRGEAG
jgi:hypothetical protein